MGHGNTAMNLWIHKIREIHYPTVEYQSLEKDNSTWSQQITNDQRFQGYIQFFLTRLSSKTILIFNP